MPFKKTDLDYREDLKDYLKTIIHKHFIVEGKQDVEALAKFGILDTHSLKGKGFHEFCEYLPQDKEYVILTDFDPAGEKIAKKLEYNLKYLEVKVDSATRSKLRKLFIDCNLNTIQGLRNID